jgi:hypothetical protein
MQFSKEEHDARAAEEKRDPMGSVFRGPQGLFPQLDGYASFLFVPCAHYHIVFVVTGNTCPGSSL